MQASACSSTDSEMGKKLSGPCLWDMSRQPPAELAGRVSAAVLVGARVRCYQSTYLPPYLSVSIYLSVCLLVCLSLYVASSRSSYLSVNLSIYMRVQLFMHLARGYTSST